MSTAGTSRDVEADLPDGLLDAIRNVPTPFYVLDVERVRRRAEQVRKAVEGVFPPSVVAYPYKVNPVAGVASTAVAVYGSAEVASVEELDLAIEHGAAMTQCLVGGVGKSAPLLARAVSDGATLKIDSLAELRRLDEIWPSLRVHEHFRMLLRLALPVDSGWSRFGLAPEEVSEVVAGEHSWDPYLRGVSFHVGTNIAEPSPYAAATRQALPVVERLAARVPDGARPVLDIGGGFPSCTDDDVATTVELYLRAIAAVVDDTGLPDDALEIVCEPGRVTVDRTGYLVATLVEAHQRNGASGVIVDAGNTLAGGSWSPVRPGRSLLLVTDATELPAVCDIYGNLCYENDVVAHGAAVIEHDELDRIAVIGDVGGYRLAAAAPWSQELPPVYGLVHERLELQREAFRLRVFS